MFVPSFKTLLIAGLGLALGACAATLPGSVPKAEFAVLESAVAGHIATLASDDFEGRRPGTRGEALTLDYMQRELESVGFVSGTNDPGNAWRAPVPLVSTRPVSGTVEFLSGRNSTRLDEEETLVLTNFQRSLVSGADVLFVGRLGEELDEALVRGKVVVLMSETGKSPARRDAIFGKGAAAVITVVEDRETIDSLRRTSSRERFELEGFDADELSVFSTQKAISAVVGQERWQELVEKAATDAFEPVELRFAATVEAESERREVRSSNLVGLLPGAKPGSGAVVMLAHWDHFGQCGEEGDEDRLCNGAADNASGVAVMLELAKRLAATGPHDRDIYVLGTTAEEWGLYGAQAFADNPPIPLTEIVAAFNFDTVAIAPRGAAVGFVGEGRTPLDGVVREVMAETGRSFGSQVLAEQFLQRQDGWALLQRDVPTLVLSSAFGDEEVLNTYLRERYHQAGDEPEGLELGGAIEDLLLHQELITRIADTTRYAPAGE